ncbi:hypothetical protein [Nocardia sp. CNY236]|uniref:hypothetical protein n=1 Tax=Nocardia sp. CNY236 TaxID=1169152 RepID=UPI0004024803|nr:hypothetical protein [Nocardia sp. CNY236]
MHLLLLISSVVLAAALIGAVVAMLLRPPPARIHLTVADLQARLAREQETGSPETDGTADSDEAANSDHDVATDDSTRPHEPAIGTGPLADSGRNPVVPMERRQLPEPSTRARDETTDITDTPVHGDSADTPSTEPRPTEQRRNRQ